MKKSDKKKYIIGIDEVGRGALAGPVVVAAIMAVNGRLRMANGRLGELKDSKRLSARRRELWYAHVLRHPTICFAVARVYPRQIEKINISGAANKAAARAYARLVARDASRVMSHAVFLDGGLYLKSSAWQTAHCPDAKTVIRADEKITAVKIASIIAKVHRDRFMCRLAKIYPGYGFELHKGYGTKSHYEALKKCGPSKAHRLTFVRK